MVFLFERPPEIVLRFLHKINNGRLFPHLKMEFEQGSCNFPLQCLFSRGNNAHGAAQRNKSTKSDTNLYAAPLFYWRGRFHFWLITQKHFSAFENCSISVILVWIAIRKSISKPVASEFQKIWNSNQNSNLNQQLAMPHPARLTKTFFLTTRVNFFTVFVSLSRHTRVYSAWP